MQMVFSIRFYSDYHTGAGYGLGTEVDSALLRDADGVPCLRGTLIEGILRNQLEILLSLKPLTSIKSKSCSGGGCAPGSEPCPLCRIFGSPHFPKLWRFGSARPENVMEPVTSGGWIPGRTASSVIWQNRVNPRTGSAEDNKLFSRERGSAELRFAFEVENLKPYPHLVTDASLLVASARMARSLGSGKNRGLGDCSIRLVDVPQDLTGYLDFKSGIDFEEQLLNYFQNHIIKSVNPSGISAISPTWMEEKDSQAGEPVRIQVIARTDEPVVIADRMEAGNQYGGANYISGRALLGALASRAASRWDLGDVNKPVYRDFISIFRRGKVCYSMLYPAYLRERRLFPCLPAPLDLLSCKIFHGFDEKHTNMHGVTAHAYSDRVPSLCKQCGDKGRDTPLEQVEGFVPLLPEREIYVPKMRQEMHVSIDRNRGRAVSGELFGYTAVDAGQYFLGEIYCRSENDWSDLSRLAGISEVETFVLYIGKALRRGYGKMRVQFKKLESKSPSFFVAQDISRRVAGVEQPLVLTFLSDAIIIDKWGRSYQSLTREWLIEQLNLDLQTSDIEIKQVFCKTGTAMGFNNHLGLPRWQDAVIKAGSTVGFSIKKQIILKTLINRLKEIEEQGLGLRRNEGFGMVAFNHPIRNGGMRIQPVRLDEEMGLKEGIRSAQPLDPVGIIDDEKYRLTASLFHDTPWLAVARWLQSRSNQNLSELISKLKNNNFPGIPKNLFEIEEYTSTKDNFFTGKGRKGKDTLINKLAEINKDLEDGSLPRKLQGAAIESLAGSIVDACRSVEGDDTDGI